jgi:hypothetical protein
LIAANAFGYEQLDRIYAGEYLIDGYRLTAFVSDRADLRPHPHWPLNTGKH